MIVKKTFQQFGNQKKFCMLFVVNLMFGLLGFVTLDFFKQSVIASVHGSSKEFLAADLAMYSRRNISDEELAAANKILPEGTRVSSLIEMYTMARVGAQSRLVLLSVVDNEFPFYGSLDLGDGRKIRNGDPKEILDRPEAWVYPELLLQLNIKEGTSILIGQKEFIVRQKIIKAAGQSSGFAALAPMVYIGRKFLSDTELIQKGSTYWRNFLYKLPPGYDVTAIRNEVNNALKEPGVRVVTHLKASEQASRLLLYLNDYLGLSSLVALILAAIGSIFLSKSYLWGEIKNIAIFRALGADYKKVALQYLGFLMLLGWISVPLTFILASLVLPFLTGILERVSFFDLNVQIQWTTLPVSLLLVSVIMIFVNAPLLLRLRNVRAAELFVESAGQSIGLGWRDFLSYLPFVLFFWLIAFWQAHSVRVSILFVGVILIASIALGLFFILCSRPLQRLAGKSRFVFKYAALAVSRKPGYSLSIFISIALCVLLISFIFNIEVSLEKEFTVTKENPIPSLFMFDIQEDQADDVEKIVKGKGLNIQDLSPMVRSKLVAVNDQKFEKSIDDENQSEMSNTRENEKEKRFRNRGMNLSYRKKMAWSESVIEGEPITTSYSEESGTTPWVSVEHRFADRLGLKIGDELTFDVQGVEIIGAIKNLRSVKWTSFQPNFFIQFQTGVLDEAPKTFLATLPELSKELKAEVQTEIVKKHPNISMVDVSRLVARLIDIFDKMGGALKLMAVLVLLAALGVVISITQNITNQRARDIQLFKILGVDLGRIKNIFIVEIYGVSLLATIFGLIMSLFVVFLFTKVVFYSEFRPSPWASLWLLLLVPLICTLFVGLGSFRLINREGKTSSI